MNPYGLTDEEIKKVSAIRQKRIEFMNEQSKKWKLIPKDRTKMAGYKKNQTLDGEGVRCSLYVSGCHFNCLDCYSPHAQNINYGKLLTDDIINDIIRDIKHPYVDGITFVGGEPFIHAPRLVQVASMIRAIPEKTIWSYSGYKIEVLLSFPKEDERRQLLELLDVLIDGQFITELRDEKSPPRFRGSDNQRIIDVQKTLKSNEVVLWDDK